MYNCVLSLCKNIAFYLINIGTEKFESVKFMWSRITLSVDTLMSDSLMVAEETCTDPFHL